MTGMPLKTAIAPHVLTVICRHHVKVTHDDLTDEALLAFLQGYAKSSLKADDYDLTSSLLTGLRTLHANAKILFRRMAYSRSLRPRQGRRSGDK